MFWTIVIGLVAFYVLFRMIHAYGKDVMSITATIGALVLGIGLVIACLYVFRALIHFLIY